MRCPCIECEKRGCGVFHDQCELYKKYTEERVLDRKDIKKKTQTITKETNKQNTTSITNKTPTSNKKLKQYVNNKNKLDKLGEN